MLRFSREVAFAAARVYARAAESRGAWDARLQALLVDALLRGDSADVLASRAAALGWADAPPVAVAVGRSPGGEAAAVLHTVLPGGPADRASRCSAACTATGWWSCSAAPPTRWPPPSSCCAAFGDGPGRGRARRCRSLDEATESARAALAGFRAAPAWPAAPRPVAADDLLPERALAGDARGPADRCGRTSYGALVRAGGELLETLDAFFAAGGVLESAARALFVHPNTVRYRLRRVAEVTGLVAADSAGRVRAADRADDRPARSGARPDAADQLEHDRRDRISTGAQHRSIAIL